MLCFCVLYLLCFWSKIMYFSLLFFHWTHCVYTEQFSLPLFLSMVWMTHQRVVKGYILSSIKSTHNNKRKFCLLLWDLAQNNDFITKVSRIYYISIPTNIYQFLFDLLILLFFIKYIELIKFIVSINFSMCVNSWLLLNCKVYRLWLWEREPQLN